MPAKKRGKGRPKKIRPAEEDDEEGEDRRRSGSDKASARKQRVEEQLIELDREGDHQMALLDKSVLNVQKQIRTSHKNLLMSIPQFVQEMTIRDFLAVGGDIQAAMKRKAEVEAKVAHQQEEPLENPKLLVAPAASSKAGTSTTSCEMDTTMDTTLRALETPATTSRGTRPCRQAARAAKDVFSTSRPTRRTRAATKYDTSLQDTPAQTPLFRPGLPLGKKGGNKADDSQRGRRDRLVTMHVNDAVIKGGLLALDKFDQLLPPNADPGQESDLQQFQAWLADVFQVSKEAHTQ